MNRRILVVLPLLVIAFLLLSGCRITIEVERLPESEEPVEIVEMPTGEENLAIADKFCIYKPDGSGFTSGGGGFTSGGGGFTSGGGGFTSGGGGGDPHGRLVWSTIQEELRDRGAELIAKDSLSSAAELLRTGTVVLLVIDQFSRIDKNSGQRLYTSMETMEETTSPPLAELWQVADTRGATTILLYPLDIELFRTDIVVERTEEAIRRLARHVPPATRFVLNMSWMILPCGDRQPESVGEYIDIVCSIPESMRDNPEEFEAFQDRLNDLRELQEFLEKFGAVDVKSMCSERDEFVRQVTLNDIYDARYYDAIWGHSIFRDRWTSGFYSRFIDDKNDFNFGMIDEIFAMDPLLPQTIEWAEPEPELDELRSILEVSCSIQTLWPTIERVLRSHYVDIDVITLCEPGGIDDIFDVYGQTESWPKLARDLMLIRDLRAFLLAVCENQTRLSPINDVLQFYLIDERMETLCLTEVNVDQFIGQHALRIEHPGLARALLATQIEEFGVVMDEAGAYLQQFCEQDSGNEEMLAQISKFLDARGISIHPCLDREELLDEAASNDNLFPLFYALIGITDQQLRFTLFSRQVISIGAAGNSQQTFPYAPALWDSVVSVSGSDCECADEPAFYSNHGEIMLDGRHPVEGGVVGTSYAAPRLSVEAAMYLLRGWANPCPFDRAIFPVLGYMPERQGIFTPDWRNLSSHDASAEYCPQFVPAP